MVEHRAIGKEDELKIRQTFQLQSCEVNLLGHAHLSRPVCVLNLL